MITDDYSPEEILSYIDPVYVKYQEWLNIGMALKKAGHPCSVWDNWSRGDPDRYHAGECEKKWQSFRGAAMQDVSMGTVVRMALEGGFSPSQPDDWEVITSIKRPQYEPDVRFIDQRWVQEEDVPPPAKDLDPVQQIRHYIETLFQMDEHVGYVVEAYPKDDDSGKWLPKKGIYTHTAAEMLERLRTCDGEIWKVIGDVNTECGAWVRFNPLDGNGVSDNNVTSFRYALVESDSLPIGKQYALIKQLQLPVALLVHSGGKSLHAIVRINADSYTEYRQRVDYLYKVCESNGLKLDTNNRNPSRLSRMPGIQRHGRWQYIVSENLGKESYEAWKEYIEATQDDLPDMEELYERFYNLPELAPELVKGILRKGHKMLIAGPSKAGKSFALIELCIAIAEGKEWLGFQCAQGRVLYVNLELDERSCLHRFHDVYEAMGIDRPHLGNITIWNLRGKSQPMNKLSPKLIRRVKEAGYTAVILDPIYKVLTGDENSADQMAAFCNEFDKIATDLGCAVIYCHHHSKGSQSGKRAADRASGSGVFARDPDAMIDMLQEEINGDDRDALVKQARAAAAYNVVREHATNYMDILQGVDIGNGTAILDRLKTERPFLYTIALKAVQEAEDRVYRRTAWKLEATLREFAPFPPFYVWFDYPIHYAAPEFGPGGSIKRTGPAFGSEEARERGMAKMQEANEEKKQKSLMEWEQAMKITGGDVRKMIDYFHDVYAESTIRNKAKRYGYTIIKGRFVNEKDVYIDEQKYRPLE